MLLILLMLSFLNDNGFTVPRLALRAREVKV